MGIGPYATDTTWATGQSWQGGYLVATVDTTTAPPTITKALRRVDAADLQSITITKDAGTARFFFFPDGSADSDDVPAQKQGGILTICDRGNPTGQRNIIVEPIGRAWVSVPAPDAITCPN